MSERWRARAVESRGGRLVAVVEDKTAGELVRVHYRLGRWRFYRDDSRLTERLGDKDAAKLAAVARRAIEAAAGELDKRLARYPEPAPAELERPQQLRTDGGAEAVEVDPPSGRHEQNGLFTMPEHSRGQLTMEG